MLYLKYSQFFIEAVAETTSKGTFFRVSISFIVFISCVSNLLSRAAARKQDDEKKPPRTFHTQIG